MVVRQVPLPLLAPVLGRLRSPSPVYSPGDGTQTLQVLMLVLLSSHGQEPPCLPAPHLFPLTRRVSQGSTMPMPGYLHSLFLLLGAAPVLDSPSLTLWPEVPVPSIPLSPFILLTALKIILFHC